MSTGKVLKIDIDAVLSSKAPKLYRLIPNGLVRRLEKLICQDDLNKMLEINAGKTGGEFCEGVLHTLEVEAQWHHPERLPHPDDRRMIFVSNHPLGGLDGMALIHLVQNHFGGQVWFVVNDLLMAVKPLESVFLPVRKFGRQTRDSLKKIEEAFAGNDPILIFPAGLCSRNRKVYVNGNKTRMVCDFEWQKMFIQKAIKYQRDIIPLYFDGANSKSFYKYANLRKSLRIPFNIEQVLLPREVFRSRGKHFKVFVGIKRAWSELSGDAKLIANELRHEVYRLKYGTDTHLSL